MTNATGGTTFEVFTDNAWWRVHQFNGSGNLTVTEAGNIQYLVTAGGGGGGNDMGGGGGGGGVLAGNTTVNTGTYTVVVGAGGTGAPGGTGGYGTIGSSSGIYEPLPAAPVEGTLGSQTNPAASPAALRAAGITTDNVYWYSTAQLAGPWQAYTRFNYLDGSDWLLMLKLFNQSDMPSGSPFWTNTTLNNETNFNLNGGGWSKYAVWNGYRFTRLAMVMNQGGPKVPPIMIWNTARTFAEAITLAGGANAANAVNNTVKCDSTDPAIGVNATYYNMTMKQGPRFFDAVGQEDYIQAYGIAMWGNNGTNSTTAEGLPSTGRAGAWIGCPLDDQGHTFNNNTNAGSDSGFGIGVAGGNPAKTSSAGYDEWTINATVNTLPAYVWVR